MMQYKNNFLSITLLGMIFFCASVYATPKVKIGVISDFPAPLGMFYDNRAIYQSSDKKISLFPEKSCDLPKDINIALTNHLAAAIKNKWGDYEITQINFDSDKELEGGYFIEGIWGRDVTSINIKNITKIMRDNSLNYALAVVPVTYYVPPLIGEGTGFGLAFNKKDSFAYTVYTILLYKNDNGTVNKVADSKKQVFYNRIGKSMSVDLNAKRYPCQAFELYSSYLENQFFPLLDNQALYLLGDKSISYSKYFKSPKKPFYYYLPH